MLLTYGEKYAYRARARLFNYLGLT
jgi:hypothetical protein